MAAHGIDGDDGYLNRQHIEKRRNGDDLVQFICGLDPADNQTQACRESGHHVDRRLSLILLSADPRDVLPAHPPRPGDAGDPADDARLNHIASRRHQDVAGLNRATRCRGFPAVTGSSCRQLFEDLTAERFF
jgi:hypothetical protein